MIKQSFDAGWEYTEETNLWMMRYARWQPITLPHDAAIGKARSPQNPSGPAGGYTWTGIVTYRKRFHVPDEWRGKAVRLEFEGVMMHAEVTVNGHLAALHPYGYTSFIVNLTPYLAYGTENEVTVVANNSAQPNSRWYTGTGIYRHVWLRVGGAVHVPPWGVFVTTPTADANTTQVVVVTEVANDSDAATAAVLRTAIVTPGGGPTVQEEAPLELAARSTITTEQTLTVSRARLWSVDAPNLYSLVSEVLVGDAVVDRETTSFGIRTITVDAAHGLRLNGVPIKLKGGCIHHDHGPLGAASYDRAEERKVELMKAAGYNALRYAHNPPAPALLDACDRLGVLVIDESFDMWRMAKSANDYHLYFEDWWQRDLESMVKRDRNHPSVIMWSIGNEVAELTGQSGGYAWSRRQADYVRALDPTRPVTQGVRPLFEEVMDQMEQGMEQLWETMAAAPPPDRDRWGELTREFVAPLDVVGYNYMHGRYQSDGERFPERVICGTESWAHEAYAVWQATSQEPHVIGDFVWTAIDYLGEAGVGRVVVDGQMPSFGAPYPYHLANCGDLDICGFKRPQSYYRDILWGVRTTPFIAVLHPEHYGRQISFMPWGWEPVLDYWTYPGWEGKPTRVEVYSADEEVELLLNGVSLGRKPAGAARQNKATFEVTYQPGTLVAVGISGGRETGRTTLTTAGDAAALRLTPDRPEIGAEAGDLSYVAVEIVDEHGVPVRHAAHEVTLEVSGAGELIALGAADPESEAPYVVAQRAAYQGRLMAVVRSTGQEGAIRVRATAPGLVADEARVSAK